MTRKSFMAASVIILSCMLSVANISFADNKDNDKNVTTKVIKPGSFDYIVCNFPVDIKYKEGESKIVVKTSDEKAEPFNYSINKGVLTLKMNAKTAFVLKDDIEVYSPSLRGVELNGAAEFESEKPIEASKFELDMNGASKAEIKGLECDKLVLTGNGSSKVEIEGLDCEVIDAQLNGTGKFTISGKADKGTFVINGAANMDITELKISDINTEVNGLGKISKHK